jgi:hypothetical protein
MKRPILHIFLALGFAVAYTGCADQQTTSFCSDPNGCTGLGEPAESTASTEAPGEEEPVNEEPRGEEPVNEDPRGEEPVNEEPRGEEPVNEEPRGEEPVNEEPRGEESSEAESGTEENQNSGAAQIEVIEENVNLLPTSALPGRGRKRMNIDQLDLAIEQVTGGIRWRSTPTSQTGMFEVLALSLGKPDYKDQTSEDLDPGALFQKFLGDAARSVCQELIAREVEASESNRLFLVHADGSQTYAEAPNMIEDNLAYLLLRYHGNEVTPGSPALNSWIWLFESATLVSQEPLVAWNTVCIGLIQHPDFYSY